MRLATPHDDIISSLPTISKYKQDKPNNTILILDESLETQKP